MKLHGAGQGVCPPAGTLKGVSRNAPFVQRMNMGNTGITTLRLPATGPAGHWKHHRHSTIFSTGLFSTLPGNGKGRSKATNRKEAK